MIEVPATADLPILMTFTGLTTVTLPARPQVPPISVCPFAPHPVRVQTADGRLIATLHPGEEAEFEIKRPPWWRVWRKPRWELTSRRRKR
jgi:hypothetical protein